MRIPLVGPPTSLVMLFGQPKLVVAFAQVVCRATTYEVGEAVAISKQAGRPGRAPYRPGRVLRVLPQPNASGYDYEVCPSFRLLFADDNRLLRELQV